MKQPAVYIITNKPNGVLYIGVTSDLVKRVWEHKNKLVDGFSNKYNLQYLVYYEVHEDMSEAIVREKQIKKWNREWKVNLVNEINPEWSDLYQSIV